MTAMPIVAVLLACQPCEKMYTADEISKGASLIAILHHGKSPPPPPKNVPPSEGASGSFTADVLTMLKGTIASKRITVTWNYGMCAYPAPMVGDAPTVVFLSGDAKNGFSPGSAGCGPVQLGYNARTKTIGVDGEALTVAEFKKRYGP